MCLEIVKREKERGVRFRLRAKGAVIGGNTN
jgi:hypothetical protein